MKRQEVIGGIGFWCCIIGIAGIGGVLEFGTGLLASISFLEIGFICLAARLKEYGKEGDMLIFCDDDTCRFNDGCGCTKEEICIRKEFGIMDGGKHKVYNSCRNYEVRDMVSKIENRMVVDSEWPDNPNEIKEKNNGPGYVQMHTGTFVAKQDAFDYAIEQCAESVSEGFREIKWTEEFREMLVEWFFSENWIEEK